MCAMNAVTARLLVATLSAILLAETALATCGGGGGGGKGGTGNAYKTSWTSTALKDALRKAETSGEGVVIYVPAATDDEQSSNKSIHRFFLTKIANDASKDRQFVQASPDLAKKLRKQHELQWKLHYALVCDWYGNPLLTLKSTDKSKLNGKKLRATLYSTSKITARLQKKLKGKLDPAAKDLERGSYASAAKRLASILLYVGYPECDQAAKLMQEIEKKGQAELDAALKLEEPARKKALRNIARKYKGSAIESKCAAELGAKTSGNTSQSQDDRSSIANTPLAQSAWQEEFADHDWSTPLTAERVQSAVDAGLAHERAGRYGLARDQYALAASLDMNDPVPHVYLGEVYRHHLGEWTKAKEEFQRVLKMDSDDIASAVALHGLGKMTIWGGDNEAGLALFAKSIARHPTPLCYRNLAVYWNTENAPKKALAYARKAFELDPEDSYNQVFFSVYLLLDGQQAQSERLIRGAKFDASMSYNYACYYAVQGKRDLVFQYLKRHFREYETTDRVRSFEMAEARMDGFFKPWFDHAEFKQITVLAGKTPWLRDER